MVLYGTVVYESGLNLIAVCHQEVANEDRLEKIDCFGACCEVHSFKY